MNCRSERIIRKPLPGLTTSLSTGSGGGGKGTEPPATGWVAAEDTRSSTPLSSW